jgi:hypothetical protein
MFYCVHRINALLIPLFLIFILLGCGGQEKPSTMTTDPTEIALNKLGAAYIRGTPPPKTKAELLSILKSCNHPERRARIYHRVWRRVKRPKSHGRPTPCCGL